MTTNRKLSVRWVTVAVLMLAMYMGSYFVVSDYQEVLTQDFVAHCRIFEGEWMVTFYQPMEYIESKIRGEPMAIYSKQSKLWRSVE